jgi:hypothetical protein
MKPASLCKALMTDNKGLPTEREREQYRSNGSALLKSFETERERDHQMSLLFFCSSIT